MDLVDIRGPEPLLAAIEFSKAHIVLENASLPSDATLLRPHCEHHSPGRLGHIQVLIQQAWGGAQGPHSSQAHRMQMLLVCRLHLDNEGSGTVVLQVWFLE